MPARELFWNCSLFRFPELFFVDLTAILKMMWLCHMVNQGLTLMEIYFQISNIPLRISDHDPYDMSRPRKGSCAVYLYHHNRAIHSPLQMSFLRLDDQSMNNFPLLSGPIFWTIRLVDTFLSIYMPLSKFLLFLYLFLCLYVHLLIQIVTISKFLLGEVCQRLFVCAKQSVSETKK